MEHSTTHSEAAHDIYGMLKWKHEPSSKEAGVVQPEWNKSIGISKYRNGHLNLPISLSLSRFVLLWSNAAIGIIEKFRCNFHWKYSRSWCVMKLLSSACTLHTHTEGVKREELQRGRRGRRTLMSTEDMFRPPEWLCLCSSHFYFL